MNKLVELDKLKAFEEYDNHQKVLHIYNEKFGLNGFISIHNSNLGAAVGGTRMFPYSSEADALQDVLRLSRSMTYKCAMAGVNYGGGKAVIIADSKSFDKKQILEAYAAEVNNLQGEFYTGEDVGISEADVQFMLSEVPYFIGKSDKAGDPSPYASLSAFYAMQSAAEYIFGNKSLKNRKVAVKGVGKVGKRLVELLVESGAFVTIADIDVNRIREIASISNLIKVVSHSEIHKLDVDVYAPCAMGGEFTEQTKKEIQARIICGVANNQLASSEVGDWFYQSGITYIPDYVANAGGLINVVDELEEGGYNPDRVRERIERVADTIKKVLEESERNHLPTNRIADKLAESIFNKTAKT
jgi:leucine dehydrogenase